MRGEQSTVVIVGTGLGGLLTGAFLQAHGHDVVWLEALAWPGGRFTHIDYEGFAVPTGAFHSLPGGKHGPIYTSLCDLGIEVDIVEPSPSMCVVIDEQSYPLDMRLGLGQRSGLARAVGSKSKPRIFARMVVAALKTLVGCDTSVSDLVRGLAAQDRILRLLDHLTKFSIGVPATLASAVDIYRSIKAQGFGRPGLLTRGTRGLVPAVLNSGIEKGAILRTHTPVDQIIVERGRATGVLTCEGEYIPADIVISNAGADKTAPLLGVHAPDEFVRRIAGAIPAHGVAHSIRCQRRMHDHDGIEFPVNLDHIAGIVPISNSCPELAPTGWSYSLAYQALDPKVDVARQLEVGCSELAGYLGDDVDIFNSAIYHDAHPAAFLAQCVGQHGRSRFAARIPGIEDLYLVGHDVAGYGIAAEIIGSSCRRLWRTLI